MSRSLALHDIPLINIPLIDRVPNKKAAAANYQVGAKRAEPTARIELAVHPTLIDCPSLARVALASRGRQLKMRFQRRNKRPVAAGTQVAPATITGCVFCKSNGGHRDAASLFRRQGFP